MSILDLVRRTSIQVLQLDLQMAIVPEQLSCSTEICMNRLLNQWIPLFISLGHVK